MAKVSDLSLKDRLWYHRYRFRKVDPLPWTSEGPPLTGARVAVITSAGLHLPEDPPFDNVKGGDFSYRWVPEDADLQRRIIQRAFHLLEKEGPGPVRQRYDPEKDA